MPYLIAHEADCDLIVHGPVKRVPITLDDGTVSETNILYNCTCGGVKVTVLLDKVGGIDEYELNTPTETLLTRVGTYVVGDDGRLH